MSKELVFHKAEQFFFVPPKPILLFPDKTLYKISTPLTEEELQSDLPLQIASTLWITAETYSKDLHKACLGLAAIQIGIPRTVILLRNREHIFVGANPSLTLHEETEITSEGCMSVPGVSVQVKRAKKITLKAFDVINKKEVEEEFEGLDAQVLQHEMDHLAGQLIVQWMKPIERETYKSQIKRFKSTKRKRK